MTVNHEERQFMRGLPKRYAGCALLQAVKDKKLRAALLAEFNDAAIADRAMRVIKGQR